MATPGKATFSFCFYMHFWVVSGRFFFLKKRTREKTRWLLLFPFFVIVAVGEPFFFPILRSLFLS